MEKFYAPSFKNLPERLSIPEALSIFISFNDFSTKSSMTLENLNLERSINPIQDGGAKRPPNQFFPCNFYKRRDWPLRLSDF